VTTVRLDSEPAVVLKKIVAPGALPPELPGFSVTARFNWPPAVRLIVAGFSERRGRISDHNQPLCFCDTPALSVWEP